MKTVAAILLLGIFLFNWIGYRLLNNFMQDKASLQLESRLDRQHYDESQLISIKIAIRHLAYYNHSTTFERVDGQIDIDGIPYQYVKRRIFKDSLEMLCIPNQAVLKLRSARDDYFKSVNDLQSARQGQKESHPSNTKIFLTDPCTITGFPSIADRHFTLIQSSHRFAAGLFSTPRSPEERPPAHLS